MCYTHEIKVQQLKWRVLVSVGTCCIIEPCFVQIIINMDRHITALSLQHWRSPDIRLGLICCHIYRSLTFFSFKFWSWTGNNNNNNIISGKLCCSSQCVLSFFGQEVELTTLFSPQRKIYYFSVWHITFIWEHQTLFAFKRSSRLVIICCN